MFANILRPSKAGKHHFVYVFLIQNIVFCIQKRMFASFLLNFSQKLANVPPGQNVGKHTPPKSGGLIRNVISATNSKLRNQGRRCARRMAQRDPRVTPAHGRVRVGTYLTYFGPPD